MVRHPVGRRWLVALLIAIALVSVAGVAVAAWQGAKQCPADAAPERCDKLAKCGNTQEAAKRCEEHARKAAYCKAHPDEPRCDEKARLRAYCEKAPDAEKCQPRDDLRAYCREHPEAEKCQRSASDKPHDKRSDAA